VLPCLSAGLVGERVRAEKWQGRASEEGSSEGEEEPPHLASEEYWSDDFDVVWEAGVHTYWEERF